MSPVFAKAVGVTHGYFNVDWRSIVWEIQTGLHTKKRDQGKKREGNIVRNTRIKKLQRCIESKQLNRTKKMMINCPSFTAWLRGIRQQRNDLNNSSPDRLIPKILGTDIRANHRRTGEAKRCKQGANSVSDFISGIRPKKSPDSRRIYLLHVIYNIYYI